MEMEFQLIIKKMEELLARGELNKVEPCLRQSMEEASEAGQYGLYVAVGNELIGFFKETGQYEKASHMSEDVLLLMEELQQEDTEHFADVLLNAAGAYRASGNEKQAYDYYVRALKIYELTLDTKDRRLIPLFQNMAVLLEERRETDNAILLRIKADSLFAENTGNKGERAENLTCLAMDYQQAGDDTEAEKCFQKALEIWGKGKDITDSFYSLALSGIGEVYAKRQEYDQSLKCYEQALEQIEKSYGRNQSYTMICSNCALLAEKLGDLEKKAYYRAIAGGMETDS